MQKQNPRPSTLKYSTCYLGFKAYLKHQTANAEPEFRLAISEEDTSGS